MAEQHKLFLSSNCRKKRSSWRWECDNDPELELYLTPLLLRVPPDVTPPAAAGTGPGLAPAEEEFKGEMSSLAVRACDKGFQALHGHGRLGQLHGCEQKQGQPITAVTSKDNQGMDACGVWGCGKATAYSFNC